MNVPIKYHFSIHGGAVSIVNSCRALDQQINLFLNPFALKRNFPESAPTRGEIRPFDLPELTRLLSPAAALTRRSDNLVDIYSHGERHWIVDDRWGICEINLLKHQWRSWVLPRPTLDAVRVAEAAILRPMAHLMRLRGIELVPAISVERAGWGALIIAPYAITGEISRLVRAGYRVIGQRWTALVRQHGCIVLRHIPGVVESLDPRSKSIGRETAWVDLTAENPWAEAEISSCDAVLAIAPGRRSTSSGRVVAAAESASLLRQCWPMAELPLNRPRVHESASTLAGQCLCVSMQLSRHEDEFLQLVEYARLRTPTRVQVVIRGALRRHFESPGRKSGALRMAG